MLVVGAAASAGGGAAGGSVGGVAARLATLARGRGAALGGHDGDESNEKEEGAHVWFLSKGRVRLEIKRRRGEKKKASRARHDYNDARNRVTSTQDNPRPPSHGRNAQRTEEQFEKRKKKREKRPRDATRRFTLLSPRTPATHNALLTCSWQAEGAKKQKAQEQRDSAWPWRECARTTEPIRNPTWRCESKFCNFPRLLQKHFT